MNTDVEKLVECYNKVQVNEAEAISMTPDQLKEYLLSIKGATPVSVEISTSPRMRKKDNPYLNVTKRTVMNGMAGQNYERSVQKAEMVANWDDNDYQPEFKADPMWGGKGARISPLVAQHFEKDEFYLVIVNPKTTLTYYVMDGKEVPQANIAPYLYDSYSSAKQSEAGIAEEDQVTQRTIKLSSIDYIRIMGKEIKVI